MGTLFMFIKDRQPQAIEFQRKLQELAKQLRNNPTKAEVMLWQHLRRRQINQWKFRRQYPLFSYIVDFYCHEHKLIIEVDGPIHEHQLVRDTARDEFMQQHGYTILRFSNDDVLQHCNAVVNKIKTLPL